ncbi:permease prefix domain 1-containing protein [Cellulomonas cellasea]|uniref:permease prefix domain 1-containing protein n=1 Tax=Cellulomonas cellasea TaxID=43670 RepID=UPI0025A4A22D|nr:permease prefix domain 1-containing protein [Cellulomonas cellasea]MDM8084383.1 permease prefix domain 1-containing protein [Cellulomonas cellasea]
MTPEPITHDAYTDRYVEAATASLPADQRADHADELRSSIRDQIDARVEQGDEPAAAEVAVLNSLGDPAVLAAGYAAQPLRLLGPRWYPTWRRVLRVILWSTLPFVALGVAISLVVEGKPFWPAVGQVAGITLTTAAWIFTITTLVFVRLDRADAPVGPWTVDSLPARDPHEGIPSGRAERAVGIVAVALAVIGLVVATIPWDVPEAGRMSVLDPALLPWSVILGLALVIAGALVTARARALGRWTTGAAALNAVIATVWAVLVIGLTAGGRLFDPAFVDFLGLDLDAQRVSAVCLVAGVVALAGWAIVDGFRRARRR